MSIIYWATALIALTGIVLNIRKNVICFYLWAISNASWCAIDLNHGIYAQSLIQAVYFGLSIYGAWKWTADSKNNKKPLLQKEND